MKRVHFINRHNFTYKWITYVELLRIVRSHNTNSCSTWQFIASRNYAFNIATRRKNAFLSHFVLNKKTKMWRRSRDSRVTTHKCLLLFHVFDTDINMCNLLLLSLLNGFDFIVFKLHIYIKNFLFEIVVLRWGFFKCNIQTIWLINNYNRNNIQ